MVESSLFRIEVIFNWIAVGLYVFSSILFSYGVIFKNIKKVDLALWIACAGLLPHAISLGVRWMWVGHGPFVGNYEIVSLMVLVMVAMFVISGYRMPGLRGLGILVMPVFFLLMGWGILSNPQMKDIPPSLRSIWLYIHVFSTKLAVGAIVIATGAAVFYLVKDMKGKKTDILPILPDIDMLDSYSYKFAAFGFVFWTIMVVSGAIWANNAWGRYWGWDIIEVWSLITWLIYGIYLHLRRFFNWKGRKGAFLIIVCFLSSGISVFFAPLVSNTIHFLYMS